MRTEHFQGIRLAYREAMPEWVREYELTGLMHQDPYIFNFTPLFSPIEESVWQDIRGNDLPFYPQIPALNYFLDFACPFKKIGIECDGRQWHDAEKDALRDSRLAAAGWTIYRIPGHECKRILPDPFDQEIFPEFDEGAARKWFMDTSEGVCIAIGAVHFPDRASQNILDLIDLAHETLRKHCSTSKF